MKRNEKIEIRVSLDEKNRLTELAKQEGDSVSGLIRELVSKYMALNSPSTKRRLPKWQLAALFLLAALIGHGLTLIPIHLHSHGTEIVSSDDPVFFVHGAIGDSAFGHSVNADTPRREFSLGGDGDKIMNIALAYAPISKDEVLVTVSVCETAPETSCDSVFEQNIFVGRVAPSVVGATTTTGKPIHIFIQEMA